jgi:hypothetical protein
MAVLIVPAAGWEIPLLLTNVEWFVIAAFVVFTTSWLWGYQPPIRWTVVLLAAAGLTSPLLVVSLPFIVVAALCRRRRLDIAVALTCVAVSVVQILGRFAGGTSPGSGHWSVIELIRYFAVRVVVAAITGARAIPHTFEVLGTLGALAVAALVVGGLVAFGLRHRGTPRLIIGYALYSSIAYVAVAIVVRPGFFTPTLPIGQIVLDGRVELWNGRYVAAPATALVVAAVYVGDRLARRSQSARWIAVAAAVVFSAVLVASFPIDLHHDSAADWAEQLSTQHRACDARHGQGEVEIHYGIPTTHPAWTLQLTCAQAFG